MEIVRNIVDLKKKIEQCNAALTYGSDDAMRRLFHDFRLELAQELPVDPFSVEYTNIQMSLYEAIAGKGYDLSNERTLFNTEDYVNKPFPYYLQSTSTAGHHLMAIAFLLGKLGLPKGARIVEFGPGWGNTTLELARLGFDVTAVDIEPSFCEVIRQRALHHAVDVRVVEDNFFWAENVTEPYDAAIFFECFHHCDDHIRLLRALRRAVKPNGQVYFASEPIFPAYPVPWGVRMDGEALWAIRNFGWLELGFDEAYFREALARTGWAGLRHVSLDLPWASVWQVRPSNETTALPAGQFPPIRGSAALWDGSSLPAETCPVNDGERARIKQLEAELAAVYRSTSWAVTGPLRWARRRLTRDVRFGNGPEAPISV